MAGVGAGIATPTLFGDMGIAPAKGADRPLLSDSIVKIGVLTELNGPYRDFSGPGSLLATRMAVEDFGGTMFGNRI